MSTKPTFTIHRVYADSPAEDIEAAADTLNDAFGYYLAPRDGPSFFAGDKTLMPYLHRYEVKSGLVGGEVYVARSTETSEVIGTAVWFGPGQELGTSNEKEQTNAFEEFKSHIRGKYPGLPGWWEDYFLPTYKRFINGAVPDNDPTYKLDSWHLWLLGVRQANQGQGVGTGLIKMMLHEAAKRLNPRERHLTVEGVDAVGFYEKLGFVARGTFTFIGEKTHGIDVPLTCLSHDGL